MSAELVFASGPGGSDGSVQGTAVGGSKPLHRFIKGQPKIVGTVLLVLGTCFFVNAVALMVNHPSQHYIGTAIPSGFMMGVLFIICGILYIITEHNPSKKTVTISLALSIVSILVAAWTLLNTLPNFAHYHHYHPYGGYSMDENFTESESMWSTYYEAMGISFQAVLVFYCFVGAIIFIVMSSLAGAALRSTKSQAIVVMTASSTETQANQ
uniref:Membrane-spanning 4-domains subfamily A member 4D-like n=1 Tax=Acanthochromis polyacanthus TaxID=80966 RepID=A0A3Q1G4F7_9TELE